MSRTTREAQPRRSRPSKLHAATGMVAAGSLLVLAACSSGDGTAEASGGEETGGGAAIGEDFDEILALAQEEGRVHLIAYPENWANYGASFDAFTEAFGVEVEVSAPEASSAEELATVTNLLGQSTQPDVLDIGYSFTQQAIDDGLIEPFFPSTWDEIPDNLKHPDGYWTGAYYGVLSIGVNANEVDVPTSFADLLDEQYKGKIGLIDPRSGAMDLAVVFAAALEFGGSLDDIQPGIDFFAELAEEGYLVSTGASTVQQLVTGETAVTFNWNYNYSGIMEEATANGVDLQVIQPADGVYGNFYAQPVTTGSPQPNAGRLWIEWLLSDEGAEIYASSGAVPARISTLVENDAIDPEILANLPDAELLEEIQFATMDQGAAGAALVADQWGERVAGAI